jgi:hypothetical protein
MTELRDFENELRATLADVVNSADEPSDLADRLVAGAAQRQAPHRVHVWLGKRWVPPALAAAAVAIVVVATVATVTAVQADRPARPAHPTPTPLPTSGPIAPTPDTSAVTTPATPTSHRKAPPPQATTSPTASKPTGNTSSASQAAPSGRWTDSKLVISARSLGAVTRGMTLAQAQTAAGTSLSSSGDGIYQPADHTLTGATVLQFSYGTTCFDATRSSSGSGTTVATPAGVRLGDPMNQIAATYGSAAKPFTADPSWTGPGNVPAGIIVQSGDGVLLFVGSSADHRGGNITSIRGADDALLASSVFC